MADVDAATAEACVERFDTTTRELIDPSPTPAWTSDAYKGKLAYITCTEDRAVPYDTQKAMMLATRKDWKVKTLHASHFAPFLTKREQLRDLVWNLVKQFAEIELEELRMKQQETGGYEKVIEEYELMDFPEGSWY